MTEYDFSEAGYQRYMQTQQRVQNWTATTASSRPVDPATPPTPALRSKSLPRHKQSSYAVEPFPPVGVDTLPAWKDKQQEALRRMQASGAPIPSSIHIHTPAHSQINITTHTNGQYLQPEAPRRAKRPPPPPLMLAPQRLEVPPVNVAPLARNPYPVPDPLTIPDADLQRGRRVRSKSSHSTRHRERSANPPPLYAPPMPPMPMSVRPPGAAAPLQPANGAYLNGLYGGPAPAHTLHAQEPAPALPILAVYGYHGDQRPPAASTRKAKSSATLKAQYYAQQEAPPVPSLPAQRAIDAQQNFYAAPRAAHSSATLYSARPAHASASTSQRTRQPRAPLPDFAAPAPHYNTAASHMVASYEPEAPGRAKPKSLFKRMFIGRKTNA